MKKGSVQVVRMIQGAKYVIFKHLKLLGYVFCELQAGD